MLALANDPSSFLVDSENSIGEFLSINPTSTALYAKVIGCSLTASNSTVIINGINSPLNNTDYGPILDPRLWFNAVPLSSRDIPFEDFFSTLFASPVPATRVRQDGMKLTLNEETLTRLLSRINTLQYMEVAMMVSASLSYAVLGDMFGYTNVSSCVGPISTYICSISHS
jgi:hypothetical protein